MTHTTTSGDYKRVFVHSASSGGGEDTAAAGRRPCACVTATLLGSFGTPFETFLQILGCISSAYAIIFCAFVHNGPKVAIKSHKHPQQQLSSTGSFFIKDHSINCMITGLYVTHCGSGGDGSKFMSKAMIGYGIGLPLSAAASTGRKNRPSPGGMAAWHGGGAKGGL